MVMVISLVSRTKSGSRERGSGQTILVPLKYDSILIIMAQFSKQLLVGLTNVWMISQLFKLPINHLWRYLIKLRRWLLLENKWIKKPKVNEVNTHGSFLVLVLNLAKLI